MKIHNNHQRLNWGILVILSLTNISLGAILDYCFGSIISPYIAPKPDQLFQELLASPLEWLKASIFTVIMSLVAALLSTTLGIFIGFSAAFAKLWSIDKWAQLIWSIPLVAIATYLLLTVGHGWAYGLALGVFLGIYPIEKHIFDFCSSRSEGISSISASFGLSRYREFRYLRLPGALQAMGTALSQSLPLCFIGETMGEYTSAKISTFSVGLGGILRYAQNYSNYTRLWLSIILMMLLVFSSGEIIRILWMKWYPSNQEREALQ